MEAVGQLTGGLAHDFNNLLAGISGALDLMGMRIAQGGSTISTSTCWPHGRGQARRRADPSAAGVLTPTDARSAAIGREPAGRRHDRADPAHGRAEHSGRDRQCSDLWPASVDASQLENAILNLCINSRDAMPDGGRIIIETANQWLDAEAALANDLPAGEYLSLTVTDTGTGMAPA